MLTGGGKRHDKWASLPKVSYLTVIQIYDCIGHNWFYNKNTMLKYVLSLISVINTDLLIRNTNTHKKELATC